MTLLAPLLAYVAGLLTILSPCVLPLTPILANGALAQHRLGPAALAVGLAGSFSLVGLFVATIGFSLGLDGEMLRIFGAVLMLAVGAILLVPALQNAFSRAVSPISNWANERTSGFAGNGLLGQFALGALLGVVWSPCVGPTLGAASALAAQGKDLASVGFVMAMFGLGAATVLIALGYAARALISKMRGGLQAAAERGKKFLGVALVVFGLLIFSGYDRALEAALVSASPEWITNLTTRF